MACGIRHAKLPSETCSPTSKATTIASGFTLPSATSPRNKPSVKLRNPVSTSSGEGQGEAPQPAGQANGKSRDLARLKGLGPEIATVRHTEVLYRQVAHRRDVAADVGRTPSLFASGRRRHDPGISTAGPPRARATMVERAWLWLRDQPDRALRRWF